MTGSHSSDVRISACVICYNGADDVAQALNSILAQDRKPSEIIVVNDGSTDNTADVVAAFGDSVRVITTKNGGPETARKIAIEAAQYPWIALSDHDDIWEENHLSRFVEAIAKYPKANFLFSNFQEFGSHARYSDKFLSMGGAFWAGTQEDTNGFIALGSNQLHRTIRKHPIFPTAMMFHRSLYDKAGGINLKFSRVGASDGELTLRMLLTAYLVADCKKTVRIQKHGDNFSADAIKVNKGEILILKACREDKRFREHWGILEKLIEEKAANMMHYAFSHRDWTVFEAAGQDIPFLKRSNGLKLRTVVSVLPRPVRQILCDNLGERTRP